MIKTFAIAPAAVNVCVEADQLINAHIGIQDSLHVRWVQTVWFVLYGCVLLAALLLNLATLQALRRRMEHLKSHNLFLINMIVADLVLCVVVLPVTPTTIIKKRWLFGAVLCRVLSGVQASAVMAVCWSLTVLAVVRYLHLRDHTRAPLSRARALTICGCVWLLASAVNTPVALASTLVDGPHVKYNTSGLCGSYCMEDWSAFPPWFKQFYGIYACTLQFILPSLLICCCYWRMHRLLESNSGAANLLFRQAVRLHNQTVKRRVHLRMLAIMATFVVSWMPLTVTNLLKDFEYDLLPSREPYVLYLLMHAVAMSSLVTNPLLMYTKSLQSSVGHIRFAYTLVAERKQSTADGRELGRLREAADDMMLSSPMRRDLSRLSLPASGRTFSKTATLRTSLSVKPMAHSNGHTRQQSHNSTLNTFV